LEPPAGGSDWADVDNDGDLDYLTSGLIAPNTGLTELFIQNAGGTFSPSDNNFPALYYGDCEFFDACESFTWIDGNTYTESNNSATYVLTNAAGCDSIVTLNLFITQPTFSIDTNSSCEAYTWIDGNTYTESNNDATFVLTNAAGCDSIVTLNLNITQPTFSIDMHSACESFTWINGTTYTESNNSATYVLTNAAGCDSLVTLNLNITQIDANTSLLGETITANAAGATYQWIDCNNNSPIAGQTNQTFTPTVSGNYAVIVGQNGCEETSDCVAVTIISVAEISADEIILFPNPSSGIFQIQSTESIRNVRVYDAVGKEIDIDYMSREIIRSIAGKLLRETTLLN
jgi:hypothetical protein